MSVGQIISTIEELRELPDRTILLTVHESSVQLTYKARPAGKWWDWVIEDGGPCTVLWEPNPDTYRRSSDA